MLIDFFFDFETRSHLDLRKVGSVKYALHPSTSATLLTWAFGRTSPVKVWRMGQATPPELMDVIYHPEKYNMVAHNVMFDYLIWIIPWAKINSGLVRPKIENLSDNMAHTCHFRVGAGLNTAAQMIGLPYSKDKDGRRIMLKQCKPGRSGEFTDLTPEEWQKFINYGIIDTKLLRDIYYTVAPLPAPERFTWEWTFRRNLQGVRIDMGLVNEMNNILEMEKPKLVDQFNGLTGHHVKINSPKCKDWFRQYYPYIQNMQADTVREMLLDKNPNIPEHARRALEIKDLAGSTSLAKITAAVNQQVFGRIYGILAYHYAQTKRWAGRGIQVQNFPRPDDRKADSLDFDMNIPNLVDVLRERRPALIDPLGFIKNLLRRIWIPDDGMKFYCGDWSKIEPTVLFWLTGMGAIPDKWYEEMAGTIYNLPPMDIGKDSEERQLGKSAALGCGYGMGHHKFRGDVLKKIGLAISEDLAKKAVYAYREKYKPITDFWKSLEWGFRQALNGTAVRLCDGKVFIMPMDHNIGTHGIQIRLPSGSYLYYHHVQLDQEGLSYLSDEGGRLGRKKLYGGLLCEHVTSATARDILVPAIYRLEQAGFDVLNLVHDEIWGQDVHGRDEEFERIMCINPAWCLDMRITADSKNGVRYLK